MVVDGDNEDQEGITDISCRSLVLAAGREQTFYRLDCNIFYVVVVGLPGLTIVDIQGIETNEQCEIEKYRNINAVSDYLPINMLCQGEDILESERLQYHSQILGDDIFKNREAITQSETCSVLASKIER